MNAVTPIHAEVVRKQHLIDPEICIRCNTCEETCPVDAVSHDDNNYVVDASKCNFCMDCIQPCPTGSIDNWRIVRTAYTIEEQFSWSDLPKQEEITVASADGSAEALDQDVRRHRGTSRKTELFRQVERLSARQREVLDLLVAGERSKEIARQLGIGEKTVAKHRATVLEKMQVDSVVGLVRLFADAHPTYGMRHALVTQCNGATSVDLSTVLQP